MSEEEKKPGSRIGRRIMNVFVTGLDEDEASAPSDAEASLEDIGKLPTFETSLAPTTPGASANGAMPADISDIDFVALYARMIPDGDPTTDPILEAFLGMVGLDEGNRRTAIGAMLKGLRANTSAISATLAKRIVAVKATVAAYQKQVDGAAGQRATALAALEEQTRTEVATLETRITELRKTLDAETAKTKGAAATERGKVEALRTRATAEELRLGQLAEFLRGLSGSAKK